MSFKERIEQELANKPIAEQLDILEGWRIYIEVSTDWLSEEDKANLDTLYQIKRQIKGLVY